MAAPRKKQNLGDNSAAARAFAGMNQHVVDLKKLIQPPGLDAFFQANNVIDQLRLNHIKMREALLPPPMEPFAPLKDIFAASNYIYDVLEKSSVSMAIGDMVHESWREQVGCLTNLSARLDAVAIFTLRENSLQMAATENVLATIDFDFLKINFDFPPPTIAAVERSLFDTTASYRALMESIPDLSRLVQMPSFVLPGATHNLYTAGHALRSLELADEGLDEELDEDEDLDEELAFVSAEYVDNLDIVELLESVHPKLVTLYLGAKEALYDNNPDRKRHALVSLRELWNNVVRVVAPKEPVLEWIAEHGENGDLDCNSRPTRRGKIKYLSRNINSPLMVDFVDQSATMSTRLHKLYGRVHELEPGLTDDQLYPILWRTESELSYLIRIWLTTAQS
ncbi:MAG: hypothetical protein OXK78_16135 [Caldilineaceae bacterium]|nr:hypothetical protein [Caldilineaceae bacterium]